MSIFEAGTRIALTFITLYVLCRILGKKLISHMTFFDFITGITIGSLGGSFVFSNRIPIHIGIVGMVIFALLALFSDVLSIKSKRARKILNGEPLLIIKDGKILKDQLLKARLTINDLLLLLRKVNIYFLDEVDFAFFETDGSLSAQKKLAYLSPNNLSFHLAPSDRGIPKTFIIDGKLVLEHLQSAGKDEEWVNSLLKKNGIKHISDIAVAQLDDQGTVFLDKRKKDTY